MKWLNEQAVLFEKECRDTLLTADKTITYTVEGVHACLCGILSDAMESGFINHNPAWRTYKYSGKKKEKVTADEETMQKIIAALENESLKYETYYKLIIQQKPKRK